MSEAMIASAVVLPDTHDEAPSPSSLKRRQSSTDHSESKRPRIDQKSPPRLPPDDRRRSSAISGKGNGAAEERKRGQRLFGALLGTLSQSSSSPAQKRRVDIEKKQQDKLKEREQELDDERRQKREKLFERRRKEQVLWDKESTRIRHEGMLSMAHFLRTEAEPPLYYKPWDLLPEEVKQIEEQVAIAQTKINSEVTSTEHEHLGDDAAKKDEVYMIQNPRLLPTAKTNLQQSPKQDNDMENPDKIANLGEHGQEQQAENSNGELNPDTNLRKSSEEVMMKVEHKGEIDTKGADEHGGEELLEGAEDSVIY